MRVRLQRGNRSAWALILAPVLVFGGVAAASAGPAAAKSGPAQQSYLPKRGTANDLDCNGWSKEYKAIAPAHRMLCTDPIQIHRWWDPKSYRWVTRTYRFDDNGHYVGHDEPSVKFISNAANSGNTMTYYMRVPVNPATPPTTSGSVVTYGELSPAPWFGLPICDPKSYPQNPCKPNSDSNSGSISDPHAAGSAFMELQFYPPGFTPFQDNISCSATQWCAALTIDSLSSKFNFVGLNPNCEEPVNFAYLQRNGVPTGPPSPQLTNNATFTANAQTLKINSGDILKVSISSPPSGFTTAVTDMTTGQSGFIVASAKNGFMNTNYKTCAGTPHTFRAEYNTARPQNQVPWAALEGGVLMEQEIGHFEVCNSLANQDPMSISYPGGQTFLDRQDFDTCIGGSEGARSVGEGPCSAKTGVCQHSDTEGTTKPIACPVNKWTSFQLCEFADGNCFQGGARIVLINGVATKQTQAVTGCEDNRYQNGDLDFDGTPYLPNTWPDGKPNTPTSAAYLGPFDAAGHPYPQVQLETDVAASEFLCNTFTGLNCQAPPLGSKFYPFWTLTNKLPVPGAPKNTCLWNFGNVISGVTTNNLGKTAQYGVPNVARFGGTIITPKPIPNPEFSGKCPQL